MSTYAKDQSQACMLYSMKVTLRSERQASRSTCSIDA